MNNLYLYQSFWLIKSQKAAGALKKQQRYDTRPRIKVPFYLTTNEGKNHKMIFLHSTFALSILGRQF